MKCVIPQAAEVFSPRDVLSGRWIMAKKERYISAYPSIKKSRGRLASEFSVIYTSLIVKLFIDTLSRRGWAFATKPHAESAETRSGCG
jgi:hypothetical protein